MFFRIYSNNLKIAVAKRMKKILILIEYYYPGLNSGGPPRSIKNIIDRLGGEFNFEILTRSNDFRSDFQYTDVEKNTWTIYEKSKVFYGDSILVLMKEFLNALIAKKYDVIYVNSFFSSFFGIIPIVLLLTHFNVKILIASRGQFSDEAIKNSRKSFQKKVVIRLVNYLAHKSKRLYWHVSSQIEKKNLCENFHQIETDRIFVCPNLPVALAENDLSMHRQKKPGTLSVVYVGRIHQFKNLKTAIYAIYKQDSIINFDIYGPIEDLKYWNQCLDIIKNRNSNVSIEYRGVLQPMKVIDTISRYNLFFLPSESENFGQSIAESLLSGTPVLIGNSTPWKKLEDWGAGWAFNCFDIENFSNTIKLMCKLNFADFNEIVYRVKLYSDEFISIDEVVDKNLEMFKTVSR
jgi:glycosyltransferase involved in cell wall biosynthesis